MSSDSTTDTNHDDEEQVEEDDVKLNGVVQDSVDPETVKSGHLSAEDDDE